MPQDHTPTQTPMDIQVGDVWECRDGVTQVEILEESRTALSYPLTGLIKEGEADLWKKNGFYISEMQEDELDLVKLISRNGSPINHT